MINVRQSDIAIKLDITQTTVSRVLRNSSNVSTKMRKKVREAAKEIGYSQNFLSILGVVIPTFEDSFFTDITKAIIETASKKNICVFITASLENQYSENLNIQSLIELRVDGLMVCVSQQTNDPKIFNHVKKLKIPLIFFDRQFEGLNFPSITFDDKNGAISAMDKIIEQGYTKIAHFAGFSSVSIGKERCEGYKYSLQKNGIEINPEWIIEGGFEIKDGYDAFIKLYNSKQLPEIIFTVNDRVALGVYQAVGELGLKIPNDIGVLGYGFNDTAQTFSPPLSIINQDPRKLGSNAAELLIYIIKNPNIPTQQNIIVEEEFIWNNSIVKRF